VRKQSFTVIAVHRDQIDVTRLSRIAFACKETDRESADDHIASRAHRNGGARLVRPEDRARAST
jgi:hypothetical protein